jgi:GT2 family glycosyltransferase
MRSRDGEMNAKRVELVTPVHNRRDITLQCLRSLSRIDRTGLDINVTVVDDGSTDGSGDAIRSQFPDVQVIRGDGNLWYTAGTNLGVKAVLQRDPDYILCFNDDSIFDEKAIGALVDCAERNPRSVIGALLLLWDEPHRVFQVAPFWDTFRGGWQHRTKQTVWTVPEVEFPVEMIVGNCVLYPREVFETFGLPDPKISAQYGDAEFTTRIRKAGWNLLIEPRARVFCKPNDPARSVFSLGLRNAMNALFIDQRHGNNLIHQFRQLRHTGPSRLAGNAAFFLFYLNLLWKKIGKPSEHETDLAADDDRKSPKLR